jgi:hypothetical protein
MRRAPRPEANLGRMAQWLGQFTGRTHATRVADAEESLRHAVEALRVASTEDEAAQKLHAVHVFAEQVVALRLRVLRARIVALSAHDRVDEGWRSPTTERAPPKRRGPPAESIASLREREAHVLEVGVEGVLSEFGVEGPR